MDDPTQEEAQSPKGKPGHEIRSVTHGLLGYLAVFTAEVQDRLSPEQAELLTRINLYAEKLSDLVLALVAKQDQDDLQ